jgi:hypothetical protein
VGRALALAVTANAQAAAALAIASGEPVQFAVGTGVSSVTNAVTSTATVT